MDSSSFVGAEDQMAGVSHTVRLTIAITTRNRAAFIGQTLDTILSQLTDEVELLVLDGASTDDTPAVMEGYQRRFPRLRYVRQDVNNGPDRDFSRSVEPRHWRHCGSCR